MDKHKYFFIVSFLRLTIATVKFAQKQNRSFVLVTAGFQNEQKRVIGRENFRPFVGYEQTLRDHFRETSRGRFGAFFVDLGKIRDKPYTYKIQNLPCLEKRLTSSTQALISSAVLSPFLPKSTFKAVDLNIWTISSTNVVFKLKFALAIRTKNFFFHLPFGLAVGAVLAHGQDQAYGSRREE
uniref:Secreted protein n=1 Tax=Romanomermis culicivorax TaxID=13658 RepID=A0A915KNM3_ROMCU